ncbi:MAG: FAD-dependent oxidoreductase [Candidatus Omnitrophica bacterium]|nr:FAD-dependent oxidoreductase [Candidatus Omnitrophota bacterium]
MPKIIIIGNSAAGFSACQALVNSSSGHEITVISEEEYPAYNRSLLVDYLSGSIPESGLFLADAEFYRKNNVNFLAGQQVYRIDTRKRKVGLKDNSRLDYDHLIIASGRKIEVPDIPGKSKDGVAAFYSLKDTKEIMEKLMVAHTVSVIGNTQASLKLAEVIAAKSKEVKVVSQSALDSAAPNEKIELINGLEPGEFIGEGELQALKLTSGKVIGISLAVFTDNYMPSSSFLKDTEIQTENGYIIVDDKMRTNMDNIFACGAVAARSGVLAGAKSWDEAAAEGILAAQNLLNNV